MFAWTLTAARLAVVLHALEVGTTALTTEAEKVRADMVCLWCVREWVWWRSKLSPFSGVFVRRDR